MDRPEDAYWVLLTYFDCCKIALICKAIELIDAGVISQPYFEFAKDFSKSVVRQYAHYNAEECYPIAEFGEFFPEIVNNTSRYI